MCEYSTVARSTSSSRATSDSGTALGPPPPARNTSKVVRSSPHQGRWIVAFAGVDDRDAAERLRGVVLRAEALDEQGTLWVHELIGAEVVDAAGTVHGRVEAVQANPASDLLVLEDGRLVPLTFVVSSGEGRVVIDPPPGLMELNA